MPDTKSLTVDLDKVYIFHGKTIGPGPVELPEAELAFDLSPDFKACVDKARTPVKAPKPAASDK